jgi:hypothetical protein
VLDGSSSEGTVTRYAGADATGGSGILTSLTQQNTAQEGRQNNACGNKNTSLVSDSAGTYPDCTAHDRSVSEGTVTRYTGAKAAGGNATGGSGILTSLIQQNTAQEGRQNNACGNANGLSLESGYTNARCSAVDESTEVGREVRREVEAGREDERED